LTVKTSNSTSQYNIEGFWIDLYKIEENKNPLKLLVSFIINLLLIPYSNCYIGRQFSQVMIIKTEKRNSVRIDTVPSILKVRSFFEDKIETQSYEHQERDYYFYNLFVNSHNY